MNSLPSIATKLVVREGFWTGGLDTNECGLGAGAVEVKDHNFIHLLSLCASQWMRVGWRGGGRRTLLDTDLGSECEQAQKTTGCREPHNHYSSEPQRSRKPATLAAEGAWE
ncbi:hypothetical protein DdX_07697 [Ditylenchus destructor]|uniref:Uncharacterized protein n=1 Tax=Ditylenchus destructor TaxID=166010 RepID=A0AAD4R7G9_9BILA|nr:hypothetical protein DdX_07697 [Ditylenchus destructor]